MDEEIKKICLRKVIVTNLNYEDEEIGEMVITIDNLCSQLEDQNVQLSPKYVRDLMEIFEQQLFRAFPQQTNTKKDHINISPDYNYFPQNEEDPQMKILYSVYKLLETFIYVMRNSNDLPLYISKAFIERIFIFFRSEDKDERKNARGVIETIYTHLECRAKDINDLLHQSFLEILDNSDQIYSCVGTFLELQLFIITNEDNLKYLPELNSLFRVLTKFHRLHYLYYFYNHLFSCSLLLLEKHPSKLVSYTKGILQFFTREEPQAAISFVTTKRMLYLLELDYILKLLLRLINEAKDESTKLTYESYFCQLIKPIVDFSLITLCSLNVNLVVMTIKMLSAPEYRKYFCKHPEITQRVLPLMREYPCFIEWNPAAYVKQCLYRTILITDSETDD